MCNGIEKVMSEAERVELNVRKHVCVTSICVSIVTKRTYSQRWMTSILEWKLSRFGALIIVSSRQLLDIYSNLSPRASQAVPPCSSNGQDTTWICCSYALWNGSVDMDLQQNRRWLSLQLSVPFRFYIVALILETV